MDSFIERRNEVYKMMKETSNIEDYRRYEREYKNIGARLFHERNKNNEDYKRMKYESLKRCLKNNDEYYEKMKEKNRIRNKEKYISKKI